MKQAAGKRSQTVLISSSAHPTIPILPMAIEIERPHQLGRARTRAMVEEIAATLARELNLTYAWEADRLVFRRRGLHGHIEVEDEAVRVFVQKGRLVPVSEAWIRREVEAVMDEYLG